MPIAWIIIYILRECIDSSLILSLLDKYWNICLTMILHEPFVNHSMIMDIIQSICSMIYLN